MALDRNQRKLATQIYKIGSKRGASKREIVSAFETARVEANFSNPVGGEGTSSGWRQETTGSYGNVNRRDTRASINRYFDETAAAGRGKGKTAGQLAQSVQRSAFPARYDEQRKEARGLYSEYRRGDRKGGGGSKKTKSSGEVINDEPNTTTETTGGEEQFDAAGYEAARKQSVLGAYLEKKNPDSLLTRMGLVSSAQPDKAAFTTTTPIKTTTTTTSSSATLDGETTTKKTQKKGGRPSGVVSRPYVQSSSGNKVAAWIAEELDAARKAGWKGTVTSGYRSAADQRRVCSQTSGPCAAPGKSRHQGKDYPNGAVDVSDAAGLDRVLRKLGSPLKWAGSKDPVHFSVPSGGSY